MNSNELDNIVVSLGVICKKYEEELLPRLRKSVVDSPPKLRCGVARGTVFTVGEDADYVGSCINMAARIQKLPGISFVFNRRGFDMERVELNDYIKEKFTIRKVSIRGIGDSELLAVLKSDISLMKAEDKKIYRIP